MKILITGPPGVGKTTLCKKIAENLKEKSSKIEGFYTEEVRDDRGVRKGFDIVSIKNVDLRKPLALADAPPVVKGPKVGKYTVMVQDFESVALKSMSDKNVDLLIIDEIGKMEMFSNKFSTKVKEIFNSKEEFSILATIPNKVTSGPLATLLESLKSGKNTKVVEVTKSNRDTIVNDIMADLKL